MIWLFDATERFAYTKSGERAFFSFGQTKHLDLCKKPVFLDFGFDVVQVERFTDAIKMVSGFGLLRSREWFAEAFLSDVRQPGSDAGAQFIPGGRGTDPWAQKSPVWKLRHPTKWNDPRADRIVTYPQWTEYIRLRDGRFRDGGRENAVWNWDDVIDRHPEIAKGWTKDEFRRMKDFFCGWAVILGGHLRILPPKAESIPVTNTVSATEHSLRSAEDHIQGGRLPILKDSTRKGLLEKARQWEISQYGRTIRPGPQHASVKESQQRTLFD
jgi:hypothetical protein